MDQPFDSEFPDEGYIPKSCARFEMRNLKGKLEMPCDNTANFKLNPMAKKDPPPSNVRPNTKSLRGWDLLGTPFAGNETSLTSITLAQRELKSWEIQIIQCHFPRRALSTHNQPEYPENILLFWSSH